MAKARAADVQASSQTGVEARADQASVRADTVRAIISVATRFAGVVDDLDSAIVEVLGEAGALTGADRAYLFMMREGGELMDNTHEWCAAGIPPERGTLQGLRAADFSWWVGELERGETIHLEDIETLPPDATHERAVLERQGIRGVTCVPVRLDGRLIGFVGFDNIHEPRAWRADESALLAMVAETFGNALLRQRHEAERERLQRELREAQRLESLGRLASGIAHDFNNQLSAVINYVALARQDLDAGDQRSEDLGAALRAAGRARSMVQRLLVFSRERQGVSRSLDVCDSVQALRPMLEHAVGDEVTLEISLAPGVPTIDVDPAHLDQLVMSPVLNARDALGARDGTVHLSVSATRSGGVQLRVYDDGPGIPADIAQHVFEPYFTTKSPPEGSGLGLSTAHGIVTGMGGSIRLESMVDTGTAAIVELPGGERREVPAAAPSEPAPKPGRGRTVLLVEDEPMVRLVVRRLLIASGYTIIDVPSPADALALAPTLPAVPTVVVSDVSLPGMPGPKLVLQLRAIWPDVPVVLISGHTGKALRQLGVPPEEVSKVLSKPFAAESLLARIEEVLLP